MSDDNETIEPLKFDQGFISHVFNFDTKSKQDMMNTIQYSVLAILPVVLLNKFIARFIPETDENKSSLELSAEIIAQVGIIFIGIFFIHRVITYFPTYSESKYENFSIINSIVSFLVIILSLQTKLGEKMNIITDRILDSITGPPKSYEQVNQTSLIENSVPVLNTAPAPPQQNNASNQFNDMQPMQEAPIMAANESLGGSFYGSSF